MTDEELIAVREAHDVTIWFVVGGGLSGRDGWRRAECSCGWTGREQLYEKAALGDRTRHLDEAAAIEEIGKEAMA